MASLEPNTYTGDHDPAMLSPSTEPVREWGALGPKIRRMHERYPELSNAAIGRKLGCSDVRVGQVLRDFLHDTGEEYFREFQANQGDIYDAVKLGALSSLTPDKLAKATASQLAIVAGIMHDKAALCRGQATSHVAVVLLDVATMMRQQMDGGE